MRRKRGLDADVQLAAVGKREPHAALRQEGRGLGDLGEAEVSAEKVARGRLTAGRGGDLSVVEAANHVATVAEVPGGGETVWGTTPPHSHPAQPSRSADFGRVGSRGRERDEIAVNFDRVGVRPHPIHPNVGVDGVGSYPNTMPQRNTVPRTRLPRHACRSPVARRPVARRLDRCRFCIQYPGAVTLATAPILPPLDDQAQLTGRVHAVLRDAIVSGRLVPGARIKQELVARDLGVSRTPVREALHLLESDGLVQLIPRRGAVVQALTHDDARDLCEMRLWLEPEAAALGAERATPRERREIERLAERTRARSADAFSLNRDFHHGLCAASQNRILLRTLDGIWSQHAALRLFIWQTEPADAFARMGREHDAIAAAFSKGDATRVRELVHEHIRAAGDEVLARIPSKENDA